MEKIPTGFKLERVKKDFWSEEADGFVWQTVAFRMVIIEIDPDTGLNMVVEIFEVPNETYEDKDETYTDHHSVATLLQIIEQYTDPETRTLTFWKSDVLEADLVPAVKYRWAGKLNFRRMAEMAGHKTNNYRQALDFLSSVWPR